MRNDEEKLSTKENELTVELDEKLTSSSVPHADSAILTTSENVILIGVDCGDGTTMRL